MKELAGGLWFAGLVAWAVLGFMPGLVLIILGMAAASWKLVHELQITKAEESWWKHYPPYGY